jgi:hypothetical protein
MENKITVKAVEFEEKSKAEIEEKLIKEHEDKQAGAEPEKEVTSEAEEGKTVTEEKVISEEPKASAPEINDEHVLSHIKNRYDKEINSLDELFEQREKNEELPEDVAAFLKYKKETGRNINDFMKLSKDYDNMDQDSLLLDYYKDQNSELDIEDVRFELDSKFAYDEDFDDEKEIKKKQVAKKKELAKAKKYFKDQKEQYKVPLESRESAVPKEEKEAYEAYRKQKQIDAQYEEEQKKRSNYFSEKTNELFNDKFEGFGFNVEENNKLVYRPSDTETLKKDQSSVMNFLSKYVDKDGYLKDAETFHKAMSVAMNPDKFAKYFYDKGKSDAVGDVSKQSKNINMTRQAPTPTPKEGPGVRVIDENRSSRLVIKKPFKNS